MNKITVIFLIFILCAIGIIGDFCLKMSANQTKYMDIKWFVPGMIIYALSAFGWFYAMKYIKLSSLGVLYSIFTIILITLLSVIYFHEKINNAEILGVIFGVASILLLIKFV